MEDIKPRIRDARPDDVSPLVEVFHKTWLATYPNAELGVSREDIEDKFKDAYSEDSLAKRKKYIETIPSNHKYLVAETEGRVVGLCRLVIEERNNLQAIYVLPEYQGKGIGRSLWLEALRFFDPKKPISVNVASYNHRAIAFYESLGFKRTGRTFTEERHRMKSGAIIPETELTIDTFNQILSK